MSPIERILQHRFDESAFDNYRELVARVDALTRHLTERHQRHLQCRAGCSRCCHNVISVSPIEAFWLKIHIARLPADALRRIAERMAANDFCPLLENDICILYEVRPVICRTHGLPHLFEFEDGDSAVQYCELNFTDIRDSYVFPKGDTINLNNLNMSLSAVNFVFLRDHAADSEIPRDVRISIADICKAVLSETNVPSA